MESKIEGNMTGKLTLDGLSGPFVVEGKVRSATFAYDPKTIQHGDGVTELLGSEGTTVTLEFSKVVQFNPKPESPEKKESVHFGKTKEWIKENILRGWRGPEGFGVREPGVEHVCEVCGGVIKARTRTHQEFCAGYTDRGRPFGEMRLYLHLDCMKPGTVLRSHFNTGDLPVSWHESDTQDTPRRAEQDRQLKEYSADAVKKSRTAIFIEEARTRKTRQLANAKEREVPKWYPEAGDVVYIPELGNATVVKVLHRPREAPSMWVKCLTESCGELEFSVRTLEKLTLVARGPKSIHTRYTAFAPFSA